MVLQKTIIDIPLTGGLDEGKGAIYVEPPSWTALENVRFTDRGYMRERAGYIYGLSGSPASHITNKGAVVARNLVSVHTAQGLNSNAVANVSALDVRTSTVTNATYSPVACDIAVNNLGYELTAWIDDGLVWAQMKGTDKRPLGPPKNLTASGQTFANATSHSLRVCSAGSRFAIFAGSDSSALIGWTAFYLFGSLTWGASVTVKAATGVPFDADGNDDDSEFIVAYWNGSATVLNRLNTSLVSQGTATITSSTGANYVGIKYASGRILAMYHTSGGNIFCASYSDDLGTTHFGHTSLGSAGTFASYPSAALSGSTWHATWWAGAQSYNTITTTGTAGTAVTLAFGAAYGSIFVHNSVVYLPLSLPQGFSGQFLQPTGLLLALYDSGSATKAAPVARFLVDRVSLVSRSRTVRTANDTATSSASFALVAFESLARFSSAADALNTGASVVTRVDFDFPGGATSFAEFDGNTYLGGGQLWCYDGTFAFESTPHQFPENLSVTFAGSAGDLSAGDYSWKAVHEWEDANGVLHRSAPSLAVTGTATATQTATVKVSKQLASCRDGSSQPEQWIALYRTTVGGSVFYLAGRWPVSNLSSTSLGYWDVPDGLADASLAEILYTEGGVLEATAPPPAWDLCIAGGRMWIVSADRRNELWYSKKLTRGIAPEFNAAQVIDVPDDVMCVRGMDDKVIAFGASGIFAIYGEGPNDTGNGGSFTEPQRIESPTGCLSRETARLPMVIAFGGERGVYVLGRGLDVQWISEPVSSSLTTGNLTGATYVPKTGDALFGDGTSIYYLNIDTGQWAKWSAPFSAGNERHMLTVDGGTNVDTVYVAERSSYSTIQFDPSVYYDRNSSGTQATILWSGTTGYIRAGSQNARQRIWRIAIRYSKTGSAQLRVLLGVDGGAMTTFRTYTNAELDTAAGHLEIHLPSEYQKTPALRIGLLVVLPDTTFGAIELRSMSAVIGVKAGLRSIPSTSRG